MGCHSPMSPAMMDPHSPHRACSGSRRTGLLGLDSQCWVAAPVTLLGPIMARGQVQVVTVTASEGGHDYHHRDKPGAAGVMTWGSGRRDPAG